MSPQADENQEARFETWQNGESIPFENEEARQAYRDRVGLIKDAVQMKQPPQRIPVCPAAGFFPVEYAGRTMHEAMYNYQILAQVWTKFFADFKPDFYNSPAGIVSARVMDVMDYLLYEWPGHGVPEEQGYQYVEREYMKADEYQDLIDDPTGFFLSRYFPRIMGALKPFERMPLMPAVNEISNLAPTLAPLGSKDFQEALDKLHEAGREAGRWFEALGGINRTVMGRGYPAFSGGFTKAPFDVIGDTMRGTRGVLMDVYRHPEELAEACERLTPFTIRAGINSALGAGHMMPIIPLHKGADGFMSEEQFARLYWPSMRKMIIGLIDAGLVPLLFAEGSYNTRLEVVSDLPPGKVIWWFDSTDMALAKKTLGRTACLAGNVPLPLLCTASETEVVDYCRVLMNTAGRGGGYIFSTGAGMQGAKPGNVRAMIDFALNHRVDG